MGRFAAMDAFVRVIETGSLSGAARQLNVGQPAVSKTIAQLEARLGVQLLLRTTHRLTPTEAGQSFYERAKRAIEEVEEAEFAARGAGFGLTGRLRVGVSVTFGSLYIVPRLSKFMDMNPGVDVELLLDDRNIDLLEGGVDVAFRLGALRDSALTARKIGECRHLVVGAPAYFARAGIPSIPSDLAEHQAIIMQVPGHGAVWTFRRGATEMTVAVQGRLRMTAGEGVRAGVLAGLGLAVASEWWFSRELREQLVSPVLYDWNLPALDLWAILPTGRRSSAKVRAFVAFMEGEVGRANASFSPPLVCS